MKKLLLITAVIALAAGSAAFATDSIPVVSPRYSCVYQSIGHAKQRLPSMPDVFRVDEHKGKHSKNYEGVITYKPEAVRERKKEASYGRLNLSFALLYSGNLYLNKKFLNGRKGWVRSETNGRFLLTWAEIPKDRQAQNSLGVPAPVKKRFRQERSAVWVDMVVSTILDVEMEEMGPTYKPTVPVIVDLEQAKVRAVTDMYLFELSQMFPAIGFKFAGLSIFQISDYELIELVAALNASEGREPLALTDNRPLE